VLDHQLRKSEQGPMVKRFLREPLVHFIFFGFVIFALYALMNDHAFSSKPRIEIDAGRVEQLSGRRRPNSRASSTTM
jgi:hypothetical protein